MSEFIRSMMSFYAILWIPFVWFALNAIGLRTTFLDLSLLWFEHVMSGEPWGIFDRG